MLVIVKNLELATDSRTGSLIHIGANEIFHTTVSAFSDLEIYFQDEVLVFFSGYDVATVGRFSATALHHFQDAVFHFPTLFRERIQFGSSPTF